RSPHQFAASSRPRSAYVGAPLAGPQPAPLSGGNLRAAAPPPPVQPGHPQESSPWDAGRCACCADTPRLITSSTCGTPCGSVTLFCSPNVHSSSLSDRDLGETR